MTRNAKKQKERTRENRNGQDGRKERWIQLAPLGLIQQNLSELLKVLKEPKMAQKNDLINQREKMRAGKWEWMEVAIEAKGGQAQMEAWYTKQIGLTAILPMTNGWANHNNKLLLCSNHSLACLKNEKDRSSLLFLLSLRIFRKQNSQEILLRELFSLVISLHSTSEMNQLNCISGEILLIKDCRESSNYVHFYKVA